MGGNWCGCPPNVEWEALLPCCGVAFTGRTYEEAHRKFEEWLSIVGGEKVAAARRDGLLTGALKGLRCEVDEATRFKIDSILRDADEVQNNANAH